MASPGDTAARGARSASSGGQRNQAQESVRVKVYLEDDAQRDMPMESSPSRAGEEAPRKPAGPRGQSQRLAQWVFVGVLAAGLVFLLYDITPAAFKNRIEAWIGLDSPGADVDSPLDMVVPDRVGLRAEIRFEPVSDVLDRQARDELDQVVVMLAEELGRVVLIDDGSGDVGNPLYGADLSAARIAVVERYLVNAGIEPHRLKVASGDGDAALQGVAGGSRDRTVHIRLDNKRSP